MGLSTAKSESTVCWHCCSGGINVEFRIFSAYNCVIRLQKKRNYITTIMYYAPAMMALSHFCFFFC